MKKLLSMLLVLLASATYAQQKQSKADSLSRRAATFVKTGTLAYNPQKALELYQQAAALGSGKAMNAIAVIYSKGLTGSADINKAILWYNRAIEAGYLNAYYNLATLYKNGQGVEQDFEKAVEVFERGIKKGSGFSMYGRGYMYYKGLGSEQNYKKAVQLFRRAIQNGSVASMYMLGIAYRNGYSVAVNTDSAKYYLLKAQSNGHPFTEYELREPKAENSFNVKDLTTGAPVNKSSKQYSKIKEFKETIHNLGNNDISGQYEGFMIKYDWSGKHIIGQSKISLYLKKDKDQLSGLWVENDTTVANISAGLDQGVLKFYNTAYRKAVNHAPTAERSYRFKDVKLKYTQMGDTVSLAGNLRLWSVETYEPENPLYLSLTRITETRADANAKVAEVALNTKMEVQTTALDGGVITEADIPLKAFPNPFDNVLNVSFVLKEAQNVSILLVDMNGRTVYSKTNNLQAGAQLISIATDAAPGSYVLKVVYGKTVQSNIIIKK